MQKILEVAIGLVLVFAVFAVLVSSITEVVAALFKMRYNNLLEGITRLFGEHDSARPLTDKVMTHPLIASLRRGTSSPSYIDAVTFATALLDEASSAQARADASRADDEARTDETTSAPAGADEIATWLAGLEGPAGTSLSALWNRADRRLDRFQHEVEDWFDRQMERASGWYGKKAQWVMVATGLVLAVALNVSAMTVVRGLWADDDLRASTAQVATVVIASNGTTPPTVTAGTTPPTTAATYQQLVDAGLPVGWNAQAWPGNDLGMLALHLIGIVIMAISASFGAPVWFDLLGKLVNLRIAGPKPQPAAEGRAPFGGAAPDPAAVA